MREAIECGLVKPSDVEAAVALVATASPHPQAFDRYLNAELYEHQKRVEQEVNRLMALRSTAKAKGDMEQAAALAEQIAKVNTWQKRP